VAKAGDKIFRLDESREENFAEVLNRTGLSQQKLATRVIEWFMDQDQLVQAMILGQVSSTDDLVELVVRRLQAPVKVGRKSDPGARAGSPRAVGPR
jgi:hypothetical protein